MISALARNFLFVCLGTDGNSLFILSAQSASGARNWAALYICKIGFTGILPKRGGELPWILRIFKSSIFRVRNPKQESWRSILSKILMRKKHQVHLLSLFCHLEFCITLLLPSYLFPFAQTSFPVLTYSKFRSPFPLGRHFSSLVLVCLHGAISSWGNMNNRFLKDKKTLKMEIRNLERAVLTPEYKSDVFQFNTCKEFILCFCSKLLCRTSWLVAPNLKDNVYLCIGRYKICRLKGEKSSGERYQK